LEAHHFCYQIILTDVFFAAQAVYCGSECQRSAWTTHKAICGSNDQLEQSLPSQDAIKKHIVQKQINDLKAYDISGHRKIISQMLGALTTDDYSRKNTN